MNKEEIENMFETLTKQWGDTDNYVNDLLSYSRNLQQENKQLKDEIAKLKMIVYGFDNGDLFSHKICEYIKQIDEEINWEEYLKFQGDDNE